MAENNSTKFNNKLGDSDGSKSFHNVVGMRKKSWEHDESLPEWAIEDPTEYGGSFDASGAFHDSENDQEKILDTIKPDSAEMISDDNQTVEYNFTAKDPTGFQEQKFEKELPPDQTEPIDIQKNKVDRMQEVADDMVAQLMMEDEYGVTSNEHEKLMHPQRTNEVNLPINLEKIRMSNSGLDYWYYMDPQNKIQGPFCATEMAEWYNAGYFDEKLLVKRNCDLHFASLGELIKFCGGTIPFLSSHLIPPIQRGPDNVQSPFLSVASDEAIDFKCKLAFLQKQYFVQQQQIILQKLSSSEPWTLLTPEQQTEILNQHFAQITLPDFLLDPNSFKNLTQNQIQDLQNQQIANFMAPSKIPSSIFHPFHVPSNNFIAPQLMGVQYNHQDQLTLLNDASHPRNQDHLTHMLQSVNLRNAASHNAADHISRNLPIPELIEGNCNSENPVKSLILQLSASKVGPSHQTSLSHNQSEEMKAQINSSPNTNSPHIFWNPISNNNLQPPSLMPAFNIIDLKDIEKRREVDFQEKVWESNHANEIMLKSYENESKVKQKSNENIGGDVNYLTEKDENMSGSTLTALNINAISSSPSTIITTTTNTKGNDIKKGSNDSSNGKLVKNRKDPENKNSSNYMNKKDSDFTIKKRDENKKVTKDLNNKKRNTDDKKPDDDFNTKDNVPKLEGNENNKRVKARNNEKNLKEKVTEAPKQESPKHQAVQSQRSSKQEQTKNLLHNTPWLIPNVPHELSLAEIEKLERKNRAESQKHEQMLKEELEKTLENETVKESISQWNANKIMPQSIKSLAEIQAEEHAKQFSSEPAGKQTFKQRDDKTRAMTATNSIWGTTTQKTAWNTGNIWGNSQASENFSTETGFWEDSNKSNFKQTLKNRTVTKSQTFANIPMHQKPANDEIVKKSTTTSLSSSSFLSGSKLKSLDSKVSATVNKKEDDLTLEFYDWCTKILITMRANVDGKRFIKK